MGAGCVRCEDAKAMECLAESLQGTRAVQWTNLSPYFLVQEKAVWLQSCSMYGCNALDLPGWLFADTVKGNLLLQQ